jgi:hypothetical protein
MGKKKVTNEQAERVLLAFEWGKYEDEKYQEFTEYYGGTLLMVFQKFVGWSNGISVRGYQNVMEAYNELVELDFLDEITEEDIERIVSLYEDFGSTT